MVVNLGFGSSSAPAARTAVLFTLKSSTFARRSIEILGILIPSEETISSNQSRPAPSPISGLGECRRDQRSKQRIQSPGQATLGAAEKWEGGRSGSSTRRRCTAARAFSDRAPPAPGVRDETADDARARLRQQFQKESDELEKIATATEKAWIDSILVLITASSAQRCRPAAGLDHAPRI